ncbi:MAG: hypothetical protein JO199_01750, partial [Candidatus Eremiobacteraeota bacterium]|nr:hypothetical protein [Candidatus Eremiobacteraeota bacterium]
DTNALAKVTIVVPDNGAATGAFSLNPIAAKVAWSPGTSYPNGASPPTYNGSTYTCGHGSCWDPLLNNVYNSNNALTPVPAADPVSLNVLDNDNNIIVPAIGTVSGAPYVPVFLDPANMHLASIAIYCNDPDVEVLSPAPDPGSPPLVPSQMNGDGGIFELAYGTTNGRYAGMGNYEDLSAQGGPHSAPAFNSPVNIEGFTTIPSGGTDGTGTNVNSPSYSAGGGGDVVGDDVAFINYDGGQNGGGPYHTNLPGATCTAYLRDAAAPHTLISSAAYYVGLAQGTINWGGNARHRHGAKR